MSSLLKFIEIYTHVNRLVEELKAYMTTGLSELNYIYKIFIIIFGL